MTGGPAPPFSDRHDALAVETVADFARVRARSAAGRLTALGPFTIVEPLGEGGMGVVYLAEQHEPVRRRVALKVMRATLATPTAVLRFLGERQALARLNHPAIAQLYEAGTTEEGSPWFAMELIDGPPITTWCDEESLSIEDRLRLFLTACDAVQHAHQKGLIHRDIKPSNVLVADGGAGPVPKLIDFGLAKAFDEPLSGGAPLTIHGFVGTPAYIAPEALNARDGIADVDVRADVYALGLLLYELLVGFQPFAVGNATLAELLRRIGEEEIPRPSELLARQDGDTRSTVARARRLAPETLARRLRDDLDWISVRATERDRERRYDSVAELAADVRRHLRHEAVEARPPSVAYRTRKLLRRHRGVTAASALILVALVGGLIARTVEAHKAREAQAEAEAVADFLAGIFSSASPWNGRGPGFTVREALDVGAERLETQLTDRPLARARLLASIGTAYTHLERPADGERLLTEAKAIRERELGPDAIPTLRLESKLALLRAGRGELVEARAMLERVVAAERRVEGNVSEGVETDLLNLATAALGPLGEHAAAERALRESLAIRETLHGPESMQFGAALHSLGSELAAQERDDEAEATLRRALAISELARGPNHNATGRILRSLGRLLMDQRRDADAGPLVRRSVEIFESTFGTGDAWTVEQIESLGVVERRLGRFPEAEANLLRSLDLRRTRTDAAATAVANAMTELGLLYWQTGRLAEAEAQLRPAAEQWRRELGPTSATTSRPILGLANVLRDQGRLAEAEPLYREALAIRVRTLPAGDPGIGEARVDCAELLRRDGRIAEAERLLASAPPRS